MPEILLNIADVQPRTCTNGPGWRAAVWVQGCTLRCPGCFNPHTHPHEARHLWDPEELAARLMSDEVEGITILGGEPFEQAEACALLARAARKRGGSIVTYSGYTYDFLQRSSLPEVQALLNATDLLIAGPYLASHKTDGRGWRGSSNQDYVFRTDRYDQSILKAARSLPLVEIWADGRSACWSGISEVSPLDDLA